MNTLLLHPKTRKQVEQFVAQPVQAIALIGPTGSGKGSVATYLGATMLNISAEKLSSYPYFKVYKPENGNISIEVAREITQFTKLKTSGNNALRRVIVIEDAQALTIEAQNALLKTLEEPPTDTVYILTLTSTANILPTIMSRIQTLTIHSIDQIQAIDYFTANGFDKLQVTQYHLMSGGKPGLIQALLSEVQGHPFTQSIQQAKEILQKDSFERLVMIDDITKQKQTESLVDAICVIARSALYAEAARENTKDAVLRRWGIVLEKTETAKRLLVQNAQAKLVLTSLFLEI
jgi:DNA polymerase III delta prime subunit